MSRLISILACGVCSVALAEEDSWQWSLGGSLENVIWDVDGPAPGLLKFYDGTLYAPRLTLSLDVQPSKHWYFHAKMRADRGFDAGDRLDGQVRLDEVMLRFRPFGDHRLNIQVGKFPTAFGAWVGEHGFYDDPFLLAPLPYGEIIGVSPTNPVIISAAAVQARASGTRRSLFDSPKINWASPIWGPSYSSGISIFGSHGKFDYALEMKNVEPGAHPNQWDLEGGDFDSPTFSGRVGYRPSAAWAFGVSASRGPYLNPEAEVFLPAGVKRGDLPHTMMGVDARWAHGDFIISGEVIYSTYETLEVGELRSLSWYLQARWKTAPGFWLSTRFGQTINNDARLASGQRVPWSSDLWRAELGMGWRITPDVLMKAQYAFTHSSGNLGGPGEQLFGWGIGWRF